MLEYSKPKCYKGRRCSKWIRYVFNLFFKAPYRVLMDFLFPGNRAGYSDDAGTYSTVISRNLDRSADDVNVRTRRDGAPMRWRARALLAF
jgi:hypothetical protein